MSLPYYADEASVSGSPYRPGTSDSSWGHGRQSTAGESQQDYNLHVSTAGPSSHLRPEAFHSAQQSAMGGPQANVYLGANSVTPRQSTFSRDQVDSGLQYPTEGPLSSFGHGAPNAMSTDTPRAASFSSSGGLDAAGHHSFGSVASSGWPNMPQTADASAYNRYVYAAQSYPGPWSTPSNMSMSQNVIYDTSSSSANTSPNRSQAYYDMSSDHLDHVGYSSQMGAHGFSMYGASSSKMPSGSYLSSSQPEYPAEEIDNMLNQVSTLYKTANTKKMAEYYRDKWARMW